MGITFLDTKQNKTKQKQDTSVLLILDCITIDLSQLTIISFATHHILRFQIM